MVRTCKRCGKELQTTDGRAKYCDACKSEIISAHFGCESATSCIVCGKPIAHKADGPGRSHLRTCSKACSDVEHHIVSHAKKNKQAGLKPTGTRRKIDDIALRARQLGTTYGILTARERMKYGNQS